MASDKQPAQSERKPTNDVLDKGEKSDFRKFTDSSATKVKEQESWRRGSGKE